MSKREREREKCAFINACALKCVCVLFCACVCVPACACQSVPLRVSMHEGLLPFLGLYILGFHNPQFERTVRTSHVLLVGSYRAP